MKTSFAAKLTEREALVLGGFGDELQGSGDIAAEKLACRGLLARGQKVENPLGGMTDQEVTHELWHRCMRHDYRITKRGRLMLQRYSKEQTRRKWADFDKAEQAAQREAMRS